MAQLYSSRRSFFGLAGGGAAALAAAPLLAQGTTAGGASVDACPIGALPAAQIAIQLFTVRSLMDENQLGLEDTLALLSSAGIAGVEIAGDYLGRSPEEFRALVEGNGMRVVGNHFGPRTMDGENLWYSDRREEIFAEAKRLGLTLVGTGHYYNVPLTVEGFREFARNLNIWGEAASKHGMKFYFHNHDGEFSRFDDLPIYSILLEETDPEHVAFELDLGWAYVAGEDVPALVSQHQARFPYFHVKDVVWREDGTRKAKDGTRNAGRAFDFANLGEGEIDWAPIFAALSDRSAHVYIIEHDDAGKILPPDAAPRPPINPAGAAHTAWQGRTYLSELTL